MNNTWKLNRDGSLASFYRYFYAKDTLPKNGCDYFWLLCLAFVLLPFVWPAVALNRFNNKIILRKSTYWDSNLQSNVLCTYYDVYSSGFVQTGLGLVFNIILIIVGGLILGPLYKSHPDFFIFHIKSFIFTIFIITAIGFVSIIAVWLFFKYLFAFIISLIPSGPQTEEEWHEYYTKQREKDLAKLKRYYEKQAHPNFFKLIGMRIMSYKEKNCPIIQWEETKQPE
jgi:hypothetical protein